MIEDEGLLQIMEGLVVHHDGTSYKKEFLERDKNMYYKRKDISKTSKVVLAKFRTQYNQYFSDASETIKFGKKYKAIVSYPSPQRIKQVFVDKDFGPQVFVYRYSNSPEDFINQSYYHKLKKTQIDYILDLNALRDLKICSFFTLLEIRRKNFTYMNIKKPQNVVTR